MIWQVDAKARVAGDPPSVLGEPSTDGGSPSTDGQDSAVIADTKRTKFKSIPSSSEPVGLQVPVPPHSIHCYNCKSEK